MTKTICDIDGKTPAETYRVSRQDETVLFAIDLCADCSDDVIRSIRSQITVTDVTPVPPMKTNVR